MLHEKRRRACARGPACVLPTVRGRRSATVATVPQRGRDRGRNPVPSGRESDELPRRIARWHIHVHRRVLRRRQLPDRAQRHGSRSPNCRIETESERGENMKRLFSTRFGLASVIVLVLASGPSDIRRTLRLPGRLSIPARSSRRRRTPSAARTVAKIICDTFVDEVAVNEPIADFDLPCGTIYETSHYHGDGTRWYVDRLVVKRHVAASLDGTWSLSPTGAGPTVKISGHWSGWTVWTTPGDDSTHVEHETSGKRLQGQRSRIRRDPSRRRVSRTPTERTMESRATSLRRSRLPCAPRSHRNPIGSPAVGRAAGSGSPADTSRVTERCSSIGSSEIRSDPRPGTCCCNRKTAPIATAPPS